jgi:hypothetical protein
MKQLPGKKNEAIIRVVMDKEELHKLLSPILQEVNQLRARVTALELMVDVLHDEREDRLDDGK